MLLICPVCNSEFSKKLSIIKKIKHAPCCSRECSYVLRSRLMQGEGNHQKGLKGELNSSFKASINIVKRGSGRYEFIYLPWHPFSEPSGRIRHHRYIVENNYTRFNSEYFSMSLCKDNQLRVILKPEYVVHHIDGNTLNNSIDNLAVMTNSEHTKLHNKQKTIIRDKSTGKIIGVIKSGELLEKPEVVNQQPIVEKDIEVSTQVQRLGGEESTNNPPTSSRLQVQEEYNRIMQKLVDDIV